jgi:hypothetical protein
MLLLKQARAFGIGIVLSTQNPVDLDYKGLSNIGTWFIGRLQTTQDIDRVIDGLGGKIGGEYSKSEIRNLLSNLNKRVFFLKSAHLDNIKLFTTRWVMSYLKGPLKADDISKLMANKKAETKVEPLTLKTKQGDDGGYSDFVPIDSSIEQYFTIDVTGNNEFMPTLQANVELHYFNQSKGVDIDESLCLSLELYEDEKCDWDSADRLDECGVYSSTAPTNAKFAPISEEISRDKGLKKTKRELINWVYRNQRLELFKSSSPRLISKPYESLGDFKVRIKDILDDKKEQEIEKLKQRYSKKEKTLLNRLNRAKERVAKEQADANRSMVDTGIAILGALFGRTTTAKIGEALSKGSRAYKERGDITMAQKEVEKIQEEIEILSEE